MHLKAPHRRFPRPFRILTGKRVQRRVFALRLHGVESPEEALGLAYHVYYGVLYMYIYMIYIYTLN